MDKVKKRGQPTKDIKKVKKNLIGFFVSEEEKTLIEKKYNEFIEINDINITKSEFLRKLILRNL